MTSCMGKTYKMWKVLCSVQCAVCSVQCAVCSVQCAVCSVQCAVCSVSNALCTDTVILYNIVKYLILIKSYLLTHTREKDEVVPAVLLSADQEVVATFANLGKAGKWQRKKTNHFCILPFFYS